jgi:hypothetical protein
MLISEEFGQYFVRLPLSKSAKIVHGNSLRIDWEEVVPKEELSFIIGNPPFYGKQYQTKYQRQDMELVFKGVKGSGILDYVAAWYLKAAQYILKTKIKTAFVSTNSITQGEQTGILWNELLNKYGVKIHFAHKTFKWNNEARGKAGVYCVIIGFANFDVKEKSIFEYENVNGEPHEIKAKNINPYLASAEDLIIIKRSKPIGEVPKIYKGNQPTDGGHLLMTNDEKIEIIRKHPSISPLIKEVVSGKEFLNNIKRWCFWLVDVAPNEIKKYPEILHRIENVREMRLSSSFEPTRDLANFPQQFRDIQNPENFIVIPATTSERRKYIPFGFYDSDYIPLNSVYIIPNGTLFNFGILMSDMHMTWVKYVCGRLESRFRYSKDIVYNNFPWPKKPLDKNIGKVQEKAQNVLDVRAEFEGSSLADLYDPLTMPPKLVKAHQELDKAVDLCYRPQAFMNEAARIEYLFDLYNQYTMPLLNDSKKTKKEKVNASVTIEN